MKLNGIALSLFIAGLFSTFGCSQKNNQLITVKSGKSIIPLSNMIFDAEQFGLEEIKNEHPLSDSEIQELHIQRIDQIDKIANYPNLNYYSLKEIYSEDNKNIVLLSRVYEMENYAWLASYDAENNLIDFLNVFYDEFAEGASQTTSIIKNNKIIITNYTMDLKTGQETNQLQTYMVNDSLNFILINQ